jgi:SAM-dependent methyltransferase
VSDILGKALLDWHRGKRDEILWINNTYGEPEEMPVDYYFRSPDELPELEVFALDHCRGKILDVGAGAGAHALPLQEKGLQVDALEISANACTVLEQRGVKSILNQDILKAEGCAQYDTILLLMNGLGLAQTIEGLKKLLKHLKTLVAPGGQILFDSSDVHYLYDNAFEPVAKPTGRYYGEIEYQYAYKGEKGEWFKWLYIDYASVAEIARAKDFQADLLAQDDEGHFLCRLTHRA